MPFVFSTDAPNRRLAILVGCTHPTWAFGCASLDDFAGGFDWVSWLSREIEIGGGKWRILVYLLNKAALVGCGAWGGEPLFGEGSSINHKLEGNPEVGRWFPKAKLDSNRRNAKKSTGPKSVEGKRRSSMNALKHGMTARFALLPDEDPAAFERRLFEWVENYRPRCDEEQFHAERRLSTLRGRFSGDGGHSRRGSS